MDELVRMGILIVAAFLAGVINTLAGVGTLLTFPALMGFGKLDSVEANATSTVALLTGSLTGAWGLRRELGEARHWLYLLLLPCVIGGAIGTLLVTRLDKAYFDALVPWLILTATLLFLAQPILAKRFAPKEDQRPTRRVTAIVIAFQFLVAIYGGYFGAGIGILMLSSLGFTGTADIRRLNALKTILAAAINIVATVVFVVEGRVNWLLGWPMALGAIGGGYTGAILSRYLPRPVVRWFVVVVGLGLSAYYFYQRFE